MLKNLVLLAGTALLAPLPALADVGVNLFGLSYHFDRTRAHESGVDNEVNPGIGVRYRIPDRESRRLQWVFDVGVYHDSGRNTALFAGAGPLWSVSEGWRVGGALAIVESDTYNHGRPFMAPFPVAAYEFRSVMLNFVYVPNISGINNVGVLGTWLTIWF